MCRPRVPDGSAASCGRAGRGRARRDRSPKRLDSRCGRPRAGHPDSTCSRCAACSWRPSPSPLRSSRRTTRVIRAARRSLQRTCARGTARLYIAPLGWIGPRCAAHAVGEAHVPQCAATAAPLRFVQPRGGGAAQRSAALRRFDEAAAHLQVSAVALLADSDSAQHYHRVHCSSLTHGRLGVATVSSAAAGAPSDRPACAVRTRPPIEGNRTRLSHSVQRAACHPPRNVCDQPPPPTAQRTPPRSDDISPAHRRTRSRRHCAAARAWSTAGCACRRSARRHRGAPPVARGPVSRAPPAVLRSAERGGPACAAGLR
jgi:hypothetical protein